MDKIEIMQYLVAESAKMRHDLPVMNEYHKKAQIKVNDWYTKYGNYNLTYEAAWREVWGSQTIPTKAKIKDNMKKIRQLALEIGREA